MSLMNILRGAADQLDFVPGFDPNKDKQGLISQIMSNVGGRMNPGGMPPIVPPGQAQAPSMGQPLMAPGGAVPMPKYKSSISPLGRMFLPNPLMEERRVNDELKYKSEMAKYEATQAAQAEAAKRQALTSQGIQSGLSGKDLLAFVTNPEEFSKRLAERQGVFSADQSFMDNGQFTQAPGADFTLGANEQRFTDTGSVVASGPEPAPDLPEGMRMGANGQPEYIPEYIETQERLRRAGAPNTNINTGAVGPQMGTIPPGYAAVRDPTNPAGFRLEAIPGGPAGTEAQGAAVARKSLENTFRTLFLNYSDLQDKGAIRDSSKGIVDNLSAYAQSTPLGREIGKVAGSPAEAMRETIEALQPAISQAIMSQPGMSARSMDSERELQFFIRSITAPTADVWANYATLHALDNRFGSGQLMNSLLQSGEISQADYDKITRSPRVAAISGAMDAKINELFTSEQGMADTITPEEAAELEELRRWKKDRGIP